MGVYYQAKNTKLNKRKGLWGGRAYLTSYCQADLLGRIHKAAGAPLAKTNDELFIRPPYTMTADDARQAAAKIKAVTLGQWAHLLMGQTFHGLVTADYSAIDLQNFALAWVEFLELSKGYTAD